MRGLAGDFATMPLKDLALYLWNRRASGALVLESRGTRKEVLLRDGLVYGASSNLPREYLGQYLINMGHITEDQFHKAYATQRETKVFLGRILELIGAVTAETLDSALETKFRETVLDAFNWFEGTFSFDRDRHPELPEGRTVTVPLGEIHKESDFRVQAWRMIRGAFPSGACTLSFKRENLVEAPKPGSIDERIFKAIEAGQSIDEMALTLHATDYFLYSRLYAYFHMGALEVHAPAARAGLDLDLDLGLGDSPSAEQLLENGRAFLSRGNPRDALAVARRSQDLAPSPAAAALLRDIEEAWTPRLRSEFLEAKGAPELLVSPEAATGLPLSAPERYLLARVDGKRSVENILRLAPLNEFEALVAFDRFLQRKWVKFG